MILAPAPMWHPLLRRCVADVDVGDGDKRLYGCRVSCHT